MANTRGRGQNSGICSALVIDSDTQFIDACKGDPIFGLLAPRVVETGEEASKVIQDPTLSFAGIFVSATISWPTALPLVKEIHKFHPATPVYILYRDFEPFSRSEIARLAVQDMIPKPVTLSNLLSRILPGLRAPELPPRNVSAIPLAVDPKRNLHDQKDEYLAVPIEDFFVETPLTFDTYIKVETRFLKIANAKESLPRDRLLKYWSTGVTHLFVLRESVMRCVSYCDLLQSNLLANPGASVEMKFLKTAGLGRELLEAFQATPADKFNVDYGLSFLGGLFNLVRQERKGNEAVAGEYLKNATHIEHAVGVSFICALLSEPLKLDAPKILKQLGLAALFHDIGLKDMPNHFSSENMKLMTEEEKALFMTHPEKGAQILKSVAGIEEITLQAIAQHHERRDNTGFPKRAKGGEIHMFAEMIGIADELSQLLIKRKSDPDLDIVNALESRVFNGFSLKVIEAFRSVFLKNGRLVA